MWIRFFPSGWHFCSRFSAFKFKGCFDFPFLPELGRRWQERSWGNGKTKQNITLFFLLFALQINKPYSSLWAAAPHYGWRRLPPIRDGMPRVSFPVFFPITGVTTKNRPKTKQNWHFSSRATQIFLPLKHFVLRPHWKLRIAENSFAVQDCTCKIWKFLILLPAVDYEKSTIKESERSNVRNESHYYFSSLFLEQLIFTHGAPRRLYMHSASDR